MSFINIEIKARTTKTDYIRSYLKTNEADFRGVDHQTDTYYDVPAGRLKLRQGTIENALIYYTRTDSFGPKKSDFNLVQVPDAGALNELLTNALGVKIIVNKIREIYYIGNVKFHLDSLRVLGDFVEIEAGNLHAEASDETLRHQCEFYMKEFGIVDEDLINVSYSDMLLERFYNVS